MKVLFLAIVFVLFGLDVAAAQQQQPRGPSPVQLAIATSQAVESLQQAANELQAENIALKKQVADLTAKVAAAPKCDPPK